MKITFITLFPEIFLPVLDSSILGRAQKKGLIEFEIINLRDFGQGGHKIVDDTPYGGGVGMVLKPDVLAAATKSVKTDSSMTILTSAAGVSFTQSMAKRFSKLNHLIIVCGHYEGVDQRYINNYIDEEISIGDYVLTGGELPAMVIADSVTRLIKGVLAKEEATQKESFENNLLEHPHFTRPAEFEGQTIPEVLLSGDHKKIDQWRQNESVVKTKQNRPDLLN
jgi:tRNA (guanine37-N1)-methyltransferase